MTHSRMMAFARSAAMALAAIFANSGTAIAQGNTCNLNDRQIIYQIDECINGNCQTGGEMLKFVGGTVLRYHANDAGTVYRLGQTIRLESDPLNSKAGQFMGPLSAHNTLLTASYEENVVTLIQDEAIKRSGDADGHVVSTQRVRIRPDCTFCDVIEFTLVGTLADGTEVGRRTMSGSKCYVSDVPPE